MIVTMEDSNEHTKIEELAASLLQTDVEEEEPLMITAVDKVKEPELPSEGMDLGNFDDLEEACRKFRTNHRLPPIDIRYDVLGRIQEMSTEAALKEDYDEAAALDALADELQKLINDDEKSANSSDKVQPLTDKLSEVQQKKNEAEQTWKERMNTVRQILDERVKELEKKHAEEQEAYEEECQSQAFLQKFSKPSPQLRQMRETQKAFAMAHNYESAKKMRDVADALQKEETNEAQKKMLAAIQSGYKQLLVRQQNEMQCLQQSCDLEITRNELDRDKELSAINKRITQINIRINEARNMKGSPTVQRQTMTRRPRSQASQSTPASPEKAQLNVNLPDVKSILKKTQKKRLK